MSEVCHDSGSPTVVLICCFVVNLDGLLAKLLFCLMSSVFYLHRFDGVLTLHLHDLGNVLDDGTTNGSRCINPMRSSIEPALAAHISEGAGLYVQKFCSIGLMHPFGCGFHR